ncbi:hypothetical protein [Sandaracinus amylolyticus]|uniref:Uncharacterized protein n=1 Tax=Sandaracinus amylolyticus TaxID=927083 RepID=A0A0F6WA58_9BACT|nr:hypothetical protein [Sandaracinus amylolyticus]AKF11258.1 hypothetical protein DB32_008407 [Sandaracinus amylolyticus]
MGHRANLVLVEHGETRVFYGHWSSIALVNELFWGHEHARAWILDHREVGDEGWLDDVWAEGGAVLDVDRRVLLLFGGEALRGDAARRCTYLGLVREVWTGWDVRWAERGVLDLAEHVGIPASRVRAEQALIDPITTLPAPDDDREASCVATFVFEDGRMRHFPLVLCVDENLGGGIELVEVARRLEGRERFVFAPARDCWLEGGFHVDVPRRRVVSWCGRDLPRLDEIAARWSGYELVHVGASWEEHVALSRGTLVIEPLPEDERIAELRASLVTGSAAGDGRALIREMIDEAQREGRSVQVNPYALDEPARGITIDRAAIFDAAVASMRARL